VADLVDWELAERIAVRASGSEPFAASYLADSLEPDFAELTVQAEELVTAETGLRALSGPARAVVTDRAGWIRANIASFRRILAPVTDRFGRRVQGPSAVVMRSASALEVGLLLGWMSGRVLGQYDLLVAADDAPEDQDVVYFVGPNVLAMEKRFGFPPREFRLWLALHEVTHRAQFTGVPWMREHYLSLIDQMLGSADLDPLKLVAALKRAVDEVRSGRSPLAEGGIAHLLATPEQRQVLDQIGGLMSLLEGHGDITMNRAGTGHVPSADRFARVLQQRRTNANLVQRTIQRLLGLEAKLNQYKQGEEFIQEIERIGDGPHAIAAVWRGPSWLPTLSEIREPREWVERVRLSEELVG
jgi:coenzyme F420 biosynthesis associated uncharacterized protein